jgi:hypothetical protein
MKHNEATEIKSTYRGGCSRASKPEAPMKSASQQLEPRWPAMIALLSVGGLRLALPRSLSAGPSWTLLVVVGVLMVPIVWAHYSGFDALKLWVMSRPQSLQLT